VALSVRPLCGLHITVFQFLRPFFKFGILCPLFGILKGLEFGVDEWGVVDVWPNLPTRSDLDTNCLCENILREMKLTNTSVSQTFFLFQSLTLSTSSSIA
jgi:hypothetical protein